MRHGHDTFAHTSQGNQTTNNYLLFCSKRNTQYKDMRKKSDIMNELTNNER